MENAHVAGFQSSQFPTCSFHDGFCAVLGIFGGIFQHLDFQVGQLGVVVARVVDVEEIDIEINPSDLQIDTYHSQGAGGQNVNKTESAVRITHIPTGTVVACQTEKSQIQNKELAMQMLRTKMYTDKLAKQQEEIGNERRLKIGTGERSEKVRTYNYPQNRVTDHRIGFTIQKLDRVIEGELDEIIDALIHYDQSMKMAGE